MMLRGCQCLFGDLSTRASALYQTFPSSSGSHAPTAKVSAVGRKMLNHAEVSGGAGDTVCGLCALQEKPTASCPAPAAGQPPAQPFELPSTHVSAGVRQKAEAEASGLFNAFSVTHCSPFLETRPVPHSVLLAEIKPCASALASLHLLS